MNVNLNGTVNYEFLQDNWEKFDIFVLEGSTRSGKTIAILQYLVLLCINNPDLTVRCVRFDAATHKESTILDLEMVLGPTMYNFILDEHYTRNKQDKKWTFFNGSSMIFSAGNDEQKIHGSPSDVLWCNEVMELPYEAYIQFKNRCRGKVIMDYNPSFSRHWVFKAILNEEGVRPENTAYKHSTFEDNPFLSREQIDGIKSSDPSIPDNVSMGTADAWRWAVYGLGKRGKLKGCVFENWDICTQEEYPKDPYQCARYGYGLDFGFQVDPSTLVEVILHQNKLFVRQIFYETSLLVTKNSSRPMEPSIQGRFEKNDINKGLPICSDSAQPESCAQLGMLGWNIVPVKKGPGSILAGINLMKKFRIYIHQSSHNLIEEFQNYKWKTQKYSDGQAALKPEPEDRWNHGIDAIRYFCVMNIPINPNDTNPVGAGRKPNRPQPINRARNRERL